MNSTFWHRGIGSEIFSNSSIDQQLQDSGLNWEVDTSDICYGHWGHEYQSDFKKAVYRTDNGKLLDTCGKNWKPYQNKEIVETFHEFCRDASLKINHLGSLEEGRVIFAAAKLPIEIDVRKVGDVVSGRILLFNFHKVGYGLNIRVQFERLVCSNGMTLPVRVGQRVINHVSSFDSSKVQRILEGAFDSAKNFEKNAELLATKSISYEEAMLLLINEFGNPKLPIDQQPATVDTCLKLFSGGAIGSEMVTAYNTAWGLLNSVTEFFNHRSQIRGGTSTHLNSLLIGSKANKQNNFYQQLVGVCKR